MKKQKILTFLAMFMLLGSLATLAAGCKGQTPQNVDSGGYTVLESGLKYKNTVVGKGTTAQAGDRLSMHYTGTLDDGTQFDSSVDRGTPFEFVLGQGDVIKGWDVGVEGMKVNGKRTLVIPYGMAYGERGIPGVIPPKATLNFEVELLKILP